MATGTEVYRLAPPHLGSAARGSSATSMIAHNRPVLTRQRPPPASRLFNHDELLSLRAHEQAWQQPTQRVRTQRPAPAPQHAGTCIKQTHDTFLSHDTRDRATPPWRMWEHSSSPELLLGTLCLWTPRCGAPPRRSHLHASPSPLPKAKPKRNPSGSAAVHAAHHLPDVLVGLADDRQHRRLVLLVGHRHVGRREEVGDLRRRLGRHL